MKLVRNAGSDRVVDRLRSALRTGCRLDAASDSLSLFALAEIEEQLAGLDGTRLILPGGDGGLGLLGDDGDRVHRNQLLGRWLAREFAGWLRKGVEIRQSRSSVPQGALVVRGPNGGPPSDALIGSLGISSRGLGLIPGSTMNLIQAAEQEEEADLVADWFDEQWSLLEGGTADAAESIIHQIERLSDYEAPSTVYARVLELLLGGDGGELDEDRIVRSATGIRESVVWQKLYKFQRDGVVGAIDKLDRYGGCIIADSVGLGKTFEALAVIKYYELRNDRVLVLCPKRIRDNWTLYAANDRRNSLAADRFNYDILNHTDLSRDGGYSGDIDLANINWGNYDLVVIDESHNFRNDLTPQKGGETRYRRLMRKVIKEGVKTRVLMLSATPVNNRLADLRNQIAFATEGSDDGLAAHGIQSIESTTRVAQKQFNRWLKSDASERTPEHLIEMLGFDYFRLLDLLTIARSRRHLEKYYGTAETGDFPERLQPINVKAEIDLQGELPSVAEINKEIKLLNLAAYAPLSYVLPHKQEAYDRKYSTRLERGEGFFRQADRERSLIHLLRVNVLKRLESSVHSFALTLGRLLSGVEATLERIERQADEVTELEIDDVDIDDPAFEGMLVGRKVKVLLADVDLIRWREDLIEDRNRLRALLAEARVVTAERDAKLKALREMIESKASNPINPGNAKLIVFTAYVDTAEYLYGHIAEWARKELGLEAALVTGAKPNKSTISDLKNDLGTVLSAFAPQAKERPADFAGEGELDLLIATDCVSEGQNLQDCDWLVNYDIHWNPVRIIQRFGRIDRIGSPNQRIQLANFWPNMELEEYIKLEQRVSGRMVLLDVSATGEENIIEQESGDQMNDLDYRRRQLLQLQETVIDLEDLSSGISITDLTLTDFRIDLADLARSPPTGFEDIALGATAVSVADEGTPPGIIFCLRAVREPAETSSYPFAPYYLVHVGEDGSIALPYTQVPQLLSRIKRACIGRDHPDPGLCERFDRKTHGGEQMAQARKLLARGVASVEGKAEERAVESLFTPGGTHGLSGEFAGIDDFEVEGMLVLLSEDG